MSEVDQRGVEFFFGLSSKGQHSGLGFGGHESPAEGKDVKK